MPLTTVELCAGGGGQALGLEMAGFHHAAVVEYENLFCTTLRANRPQWKTLEMDIRHFHAEDYKGIDLLAGGVPCPPFSIAGKQLGAEDERDMFPTALKIIEQIKPRAVMLENVPGLASAKFEGYRKNLLAKIAKLGYQPEFKIIQASDYGVPQLRPRFILIALRPCDAEFFQWPIPQPNKALAGEKLVDLMAERGWLGAENWASNRAAGIAPTLVGGSKKHGGPDLGPTRAKKQWRQLGVDGLGIANEAPGADFPFEGFPRLTVRMAARIQSFPDEWQFLGGKTAAYRQVGNAFPPLAAKAMGRAIRAALENKNLSDRPRGVLFQSKLFEKTSSASKTSAKPVRYKKAAKAARVS
jgi:DNA (cytosine-5)-methyltransferase 1